MNKKRTLDILRDFLGNGAKKEIQALLKTKWGETRSISYINKVLDPDDTRWNDHIIQAAIIVAHRRKREKVKIEQSLTRIAE